jgi:hypothetical protein
MTGGSTGNSGFSGIELPPAYGREILRCEVGSTLHGTGLGVALEDHDEMGLFLEWPHSTIGLGQAEHYVTRTAPEGHRSQPGDTDLVVYSARKWAKLALAGNPTVLLVLFAPPDKLMITSDAGEELRANANWFASKRAGRAFLGYMEKQRQRLTGDRGRAGRIRHRGDCPRCAGVGVAGCSVCGGSGVLPDWKYAMHMLRLGHQGVEILSTGHLTLPEPGDLGEHLRAVRRGDVEILDVLAEAEQLEADPTALIEGDSPFPDHPDPAPIDDWLIRAHQQLWTRTG